jgi:hypothetical protein
MYIQLYALYIDTCITSNMYIQLYALYIEERHGVRIPDVLAEAFSESPGGGVHRQPPAGATLSSTTPGRGWTRTATASSVHCARVCHGKCYTHGSAAATSCESVTESEHQDPLAIAATDI